ncbi:MAG: L-ribulose-5-phosphate 4-epimerase AraD [Spirochaetales bacterium]|nr:L-ribulose-5-phosphate 4-epimerase AraD [Spirochaetales bacterium]
MNDFKALKQRAYECNMELVKQQLVIRTFGNASCLDRERKVFAIKPSGIPYEDLRPDKFVIVDLNNNIIEGDYKPSSDTKTHTVLYNHFPLIGGIVHTHSTYAVAWAQAMKPIPVYGTTHADHLSLDIPCTKVISDAAILGDYEIETGNLIVETFKTLSYEEIQMVLVACHGPFTWGETPEKAVYNSIMLEELAKMACITMQINPGAGRIKQTLIIKHYERKHGKNAYYGQDTGQNK